MARAEAAWKATGASEQPLRRLGGQLRLVHPLADTSPVAVQRQNRDLVIDLCEQKGISYFVVPELGARRSRVGVAEEHWGDLVDALFREGEEAPLYLGVQAHTRSGFQKRWPGLSSDPQVRRAAREQASIEVFRLVMPREGGPPYGQPWACVVERWRRDPDDSLVAPTRNQRSSTLGVGFQDLGSIVQDGRSLPVPAVFVRRQIFDVDFPVDAVYTWVNGEDPAWLTRRARALGQLEQVFDQHKNAVTEARFRDGGELMYSLRSLERYAPWIRRVFLVTDQQVPSWLVTSHPLLTVVDHKELFRDAGAVPNFNSHAIGARLHHIDGLSEQYLYFNDDSFIGRPVQPDLFFLSNGCSKFFLSRSTLPFRRASGSLPHEQARRNVVELLNRDFGRSPTRVFFHTPIPQRRSTMFELEGLYPDEFARTWNSQFRNVGDFEINSWLHHYYGYLKGYAVPGSIRYDYFSMDQPTVTRRLARRRRARDLDVFCVNDADHALAKVRAGMADQLAAYFPVASSFERNAPTSRPDRSRPSAHAGRESTAPIEEIGEPVSQSAVGDSSSV